MRSASLVGFLFVLASFFITAPSSAAPKETKAEPASSQAPEEVVVPVATTQAHVEEVAPGIYVVVKGPTERARIRYALWAESLSGDRQSVYDAEGFPPFRHYENFAGARTEHWSYPRSHMTYVFRDGMLVRTEICSITFAQKDPYVSRGVRPAY